MPPAREAIGTGACQPGRAEILLRVLAISGYGLWIWLGIALALGLHRIGRCDTRMPLMLGAVLVSAGLLLVCLRLPTTSHRYGWKPGRDRRPTHDALMALASFLPVLLVIALGDGNKYPWAVRLAGVALMLSSLICLVHTVQRYRDRLSPFLQRASSSLPVSRLITAGYGGGLWLWLCAMAQGGLEPAGTTYPWVLLLLMLALVLGLLEGMRWQSLGTRHASPHDIDGRAVSPARVMAALFVYGVPCVALLLTERFGGGLLAAAVAVPSCLLGKMLEQHSYEVALAADASALT